MTKYLNDKFSVSVGGPEYAEGWERIFGKKEIDPSDPAEVVKLADKVRDRWNETFFGTMEETVQEVQQHLETVETDLAFDTFAMGLQKALDEYWRTGHRSDIRVQVEEFHRAYGQPVLDTPQVPSEERVRFRMKLIGEEYLELVSSVFGVDPESHKASVEILNQVYDLAPIKVDLPKAIDALHDIDYVVEGMRLELGVNGSPIACEVHRANMSKFGEDGKPVLNEFGKVIKGPNFSPPDIEGELIKQGWVKP